MKQYKLSSKSDMKRFERDILKKAKSIAENEMRSKNIEVECKNCKRKIYAHYKYNRCPLCGFTFILNNDITFLQ